MGVIVDRCAANEVFLTLEKLNIRYYKSQSLDFLYSPVNTHPDMQIHFISDNCAVTAPSVFEYYKSILPANISLIKGDADPQNTYPGDCAYNVAKLGNRIIGNLKYIDSKIKEIYDKMGYEFINVKQGYTKCNMCIVDNNSVITEDEGIFKTLTRCGIDVLLLNTHSVKLNGFEYGFIGGASGFLKPGCLALFGDLKFHPEENQIKTFLKKNGVNITSLLSTNVTDFGSLIYLNDC